MDHLTFDEIVKAVFANEYTPENARLMAKVSSHVMSCEECNRIYEAVYDIYELGFEQGMDVVKERLQIASCEYEKNEVEGKEEIKEGKSLLSSIFLSIQNGKKVVLNSIQNAFGIEYYFSYPTALATRGGEQKIVMDRLVDDENYDNQISISQGVLSVQLSGQDYFERGITSPYLDVFSGDAVLYSGPMDTSGNLITKCIPIKNDGEISLKIWGNHV